MSIFMSISLDLRCAILFDNRKLVNNIVNLKREYARKMNLRTLINLRLDLKPYSERIRFR